MTDAIATNTPTPEECAHAVRQLWDYLDGRLSKSERERVSAHLAICAVCTSHYAFERSFLDAVRSLRRDDDPEFTSLRARVAEALRREGEKGER